MLKAVDDCLNGKEENYILPFLWLHGEDEKTLRSYMAAISDANIRAVCLESRPHPDFLGPAWWHDLDIILEEAKSRNMKVWILDDQHFPTGSAAGAMKTAPAGLQKQYLACNMTDVCGPQRRVRLDMSKLAGTPGNPFDLQPPAYDDDRLLAVVAARLDGAVDCSLNHVDEAVVLTEKVKNDWLIWDVPEGMWRVFVFYITHNGGKPNYINLVDSASCKVLLDTVYEAHYAHYADDFGTTIAGFFSDEPCLGNVVKNTQGCIIGQTRMSLPWSGQMEAALRKIWGENYDMKLPALWGELGTPEETAAIREGYMNVLTNLVKSCFSEQIGDWCRNHGVEYIGHIIEDNNASEGLGDSVGHYFRSLWGQDMAGIDDIGSQITVGGANVEHVSVVGSGDGEFYHHVLGKLGSSLAHIDPKKRDRCVCECFGAYGWSEGTQTMKYIADQLLADGVNHFVPHAFSAKAFPDFDCPPHFYAGGEDVLFPAFGKLMAYMNRTAHILTAYHHTAPAAVLYHAEAAWSGRRYIKMQKCARVLREHQIDFDILPSETLNLEDNVLSVNGRQYKALIVPGCEHLGKNAAEFCAAAKKAGFPVYFSDFAPKGVEGEVVELKRLPDVLAGTAHVTLTPGHKDIRIYHGINDEKEHVYFLFNSSPWASFEGTMQAEAAQYCYRYDPMENRLHHQALNKGKVSVKLNPMESVLFIMTNVERDAEEELPDMTESVLLTGKWSISLEENGSFVPYTVTESLDGIMKDGWSGTIRYEYQIPKGTLPKDIAHVVLRLTQVRETAAVWCNEKFVGDAVAAPFRFNLTDTWKEGENSLRIEVTSTMEQKVKAASGGRDLFIFIQKAWYGYGLSDVPVLEYCPDKEL